MGTTKRIGFRFSNEKEETTEKNEVALTVAEKVNMVEIDKTIDEISGLTAQIMKQREFAKQEIRKLLTDEQRMIFDTRHHQPGIHKKIIKEFHEE